MYGPRPRSIEANFNKILLLTLFAVGVAACTGYSEAVPSQQLQPTVIPPHTEQTSPTLTKPTLTAEVFTTPPFILSASPPQWNTGEAKEQIEIRMINAILERISARPDQFAAASEVLQQKYLKAVINIDFLTNGAPWGGTGTFIGVNYITNESIFLTETHVMLNGNDRFRIKQPHTNLDREISLSEVTIANSAPGYFSDISVVKLPFIPEGIEAFPVTGSDLCIKTEPTEGMQLTGFGFPFINGGPGFTQFLMQGNVETVGDPITGFGRCWFENSTGKLYIPTNIPNRVGTSGILMLDANGKEVGLVSATSPSGVVMQPLDSTTLNSLVNQTGFVASP